MMPVAMRYSPAIDVVSRPDSATIGKYCRLLLIFVGLLIFLQLGCSKETRKIFADLAALRSDLIKEYQTENINLSVQNARVLHIQFINTAFNELDRQSQLSKAHEVALFAKTHYRAIQLIEGIAVTFLVQKNYIIFHYSNGLASFYFETRRLRDELAIANQQSSPGPVIADYNAGANNTDVYLAENLRLYGVEGGGLVVLVHFVCPGRKVCEPEAVDFDFTTDSRKKMFEGDPRLTIVSDGQVVFSGKAELARTTGFEFAGSVDQSFAAKIPYQQFVKMSAGRNVTVITGPYKFELTNEQLKALQAMKSCVAKGEC